MTRSKTWMAGSSQAMTHHRMAAFRLPLTSWNPVAIHPLFGHSFRRGNLLSDSGYRICKPAREPILSTLPLTVAAVSLAIWIYMIAGRGGFWRTRGSRPRAAAATRGVAGDRCGVPARVEARRRRLRRSILTCRIGGSPWCGGRPSLDGTGHRRGMPPPRSRVGPSHGAHRHALPAGWTASCGR